MICDWYQATIPDELQSVMMHLTGSNGLKPVSAKSGLMGYKNRWFLNDENDITAATVLFGSANPRQQNPHVISTSSWADKVMKLTRDRWPEHTVTRIDVAEDMNEQGLFDSLTERLMSLAKEKGLKTSVSGDWLSPTAEDGRTLYLGSPASSVRVRLYEKGKKTANELFHSRGLASPADFPIDWVRLELQCRPQKKQREVAHKLELEEFWGFSNWSKVLADEVLNYEVPRVKAVDWSKSNDELTLTWLAKQYGNFFNRMVNRSLGGSWEDLGLVLRDYYQDYINLK